MTHVQKNCSVQTDLHVHQTCVVDSATDVETAFRSFQMTALTWQHKPHLLNKKQLISWTRNMVAELRCKQLVSSGCWFECWHGLLASQPFLFVAPIFVWFPICWCSNVSHGRHGNNEKHGDRKPYRPAGSEHCLRTRGKVWCRAARDGPAAEVVQENLYTRVQTQSSELIAAMVWGKPGVPSYGACNDWELVMLPYTRN